MNTLLLLVVLTTSTLVLRTGDRIDVEGPIREKDGVVTFRSDGLLFSMPLEEIDVEASNKADAEKESAAEQEKERKLRLSPEERKRLFDELAKNHSGTPAPTQPLLDEARAARVDDEADAPPKRDEHSWRREARGYQEAVIRAKEDLALLEARIEELRGQIRSFFSLGYNASQFTYQTTQLARAEERIPQARLEVKRAEREFKRFQDDARRQGALPGWLDR
ncbi:MAG TPA: hypothetical protein VF608_11160 [Thermoanaerobaculia bacterium]